MSVLRIKEILNEKGISGKELAEKMGVSDNTISLMLTGKTLPRLKLLLLIADELDVDIRELFNPSKEIDLLHAIYIKDGQNYKEIGKLKL